MEAAESLGILEEQTAIDDIIETDGASTQTVKIMTTITDDLLVVAHDVEIWLDGVLEDSKELEEGSLADSYDATFYGLAVKKKQELIIRVIAEDVAGNIVVEEYLYNFTGGAGITLPIVFGIVILSNLLLIPLIKRRNKN